MLGLLGLIIRLAVTAFMLGVVLPLAVYLGWLGFGYAWPTLVEEISLLALAVAGIAIVLYVPAVLMVVFGPIGAVWDID